ADAQRAKAKRKKRADLAARAAAYVPDGEPPWRVVEGDCLEQLARLEAGSARLVFADPPYNEGVDYGGGGAPDRRAGGEYPAGVPAAGCGRRRAAGGCSPRRPTPAALTASGARRACPPAAGWCGWRASGSPAPTPPAAAPASSSPPPAPRPATSSTPTP